MQIPRRGRAIGNAASDLSNQRHIAQAVLAGTPQRREEPLGIQRGEVRRGVANQGPDGQPGAFLLNLGGPPAP